MTDSPHRPRAVPCAARPEDQVDGPATAELLELYTRQDADDEAPVTVTFKLTRDLNKRLDRYLVDRVPFLSRTSLQRLIRENAVTVNGRVPKPSTNLRRGDEIVAMLPPPPSTEIGADEIPLDVLHEDEHLIVVNKQSGLIVHPARSIRRGTLVNALAWHFLHSGTGRLSSVGEDLARPGIVHRLDRHTTGVIVAAKNDVAHWRLAKLFEARKTRKRYLAIVHGHVEPDSGIADYPLGKHPTIRERYAVRWDDSGKASQTVVRVVERYPAAARHDECTLVELDLLTGRTHQIRVHLSHLGWPIVGDDLYDGVALPDLIDRQALHASTLAFAHPIDGRAMLFTAPVPEDFRRTIRALRRRGVEFVDAPGMSVDLAALGLARDPDEVNRSSFS